MNPKFKNFLECIVGILTGLVGTLLLLSLFDQLSIPPRTLQTYPYFVNPDKLYYTVAGDQTEHFDLKPPTVNAVDADIEEILHNSTYHVITHPRGYWLIMRHGEDEIVVKRDK